VTRRHPRDDLHRPATLVVLALLPALVAATIAAGTGAARPTAAPAQAARRPAAAPPLAAAAGRTAPRRPPEAAIAWRRSRSIGLPWAGRLAGGVELPAEGAHFVTWDPVRHRSPNRFWRRHGSDRLVRLVLRVAREYAAAHPGAPRLVVGDLSRPRGGGFGRRYGGDGHRSHQNGLDVDIYYPRRDGAERAPTRVAQIDRRLAQDLVDRFVRARAELVFVGPRTGLRGRRLVVVPLGNHDDHLHVRIHPAPRARAGR
jgi:murein endopeptidase